MTIETAPAASLPDIRQASLSNALGALGRSAYTLLVTPEHEKLHKVLEAAHAEGPHQPLTETADVTAKQVEDVVLAHANLQPPHPVEGKRLLQLSGMLIQFADYSPKVYESVRVPFSHVEELHTAVTSYAAENGPVGFADQLKIALGQTNGDLTEAMWRLLITSRLNARWLDGRAIEDMPDMSTDEKVQHMQQWRAAITALKPPLEGLSQDPNGDVYYAWTHALAKYIFTLAPVRNTSVTRAATAVFHRGTGIMHKLVHSINKQGVQSDHSIAAHYGNLMGQACVDAIRSNLEAEVTPDKLDAWQNIADQDEEPLPLASM